MPKALPVTRGRKFLQVLEGARTIFLRDGFEGAAVDDIAGTDGIDAVFVGLSDLAATMGHLGQPAHPEVESAFAHVVTRARRAGKPVGTLAANPALARSAEDYGCRFIAVGTDVGLLAGGGRRLLAQARGMVSGR